MEVSGYGVANLVMLNHDPSEYIRGIKQILISDKKRIGFLFGAGSLVGT